MEDKNEIIEQIRRKAAVYTKEWRFDQDNPDIGTAVALVYADLHYDTKARFQKLPFKMQHSFFNQCNALLLPAVPAKGYVQFFLVNDEAEGVMVPRGTMVSAPDAGEEVLTYETQNKLFVTPARIVSIYRTWDACDSIYKIYDSSFLNQRIPLYCGKFPNLQEHILYFCHRDALPTKDTASYLITFYGRDEHPVRRELINRLADPEIAEFSYSAGEGFCSFDVSAEQEGRLLLEKGREQPPFITMELEGINSGWIRCRIKKLEEIRELFLSKIRFSSRSEKAVPENIFGNDLPCSSEYFLPFGEEPSAFTELYIGSRLFDKKGAEITISFCLDFRKTPYGDWETEEVQWNWIMKRPEKKQEMIYETSVLSVLWEYYNGKGWTSLFRGEKYSDIFSQKQEAQSYRSLRFKGPLDMEPVLIGALETYYIRARVVKIANPYKRKGNYLAPVLSNLVLDHAYPTDALFPEHILTVNTLKTEVFGGNRPPFYQTDQRSQTLYLGFQTAPVGSPIGFLLAFEEYREYSRGGFDWEYYGKGRWRKLNVMDGTAAMSKTGVVTWNGTEDFSLLTLFGEEQYWIRILDREDQYGELERTKASPVLTGIYANTAEVMQLSCIETEYFSLEAYQESPSFLLLHQNIYDGELWVEEGKEGGGRSWIKWQQVTDFKDSKELDRHFMLKQAEGKLLFGDGKRGRIPPVSKKETIRITYRSGGGEKTNLLQGMVTKMEDSIGFINRVNNPLPIAGGQDAEAPGEAMRRCAARLRSQNRAVTARDFETLAMEACRDILTAQCFSGKNGAGEHSPGFVTLVLVLKDAVNRRDRFPLLKDQIYDWLKERADGNLIRSGRFLIREPEFVWVCVRVQLMVEDFEQVSSVKEMVKPILKEFLNGFSVGTFPTADQIRNEIYRTDGIFCIEKLYIRTFQGRKNSLKEADEGILRKHPYVYPISGEHEIIVRVGGL